MTNTNILADGQDVSDKIKCLSLPQNNKHWQAKAL